MTGIAWEKTAWSSGRLALPGRTGWSGRRAASRIARSRPRRPTPALDRPEQAQADLPLLAGGLATLEVEGREAEVGLGPAKPEFARPGAWPARPQIACPAGLRESTDLCRIASLPLGVRAATSAADRQQRQPPRRRSEPATAGFRRAHRQACSAAETRRARIGRSSRNRCRSSASAAAVAYRCAGSRAIALSDDRLQVARHRPVQLAAAAAAPRAVTCSDQLCAVRRLERRPQRQQLVERQPQARRRRARGVALALGTAPAPCSGSCRRCRRCGSGRRPSAALASPKSATQTLPSAVEQQVRRLDVAVEDALAVGVLQRLGHLHADPGHALRQNRRSVSDERRDARHGRRLDRPEARTAMGAEAARPAVGVGDQGRVAVPGGGSPSPVAGANRPVTSDRAISAADRCALRPAARAPRSGRSTRACRSRRSSSRTASSPWPWMNCMT